MTDRVRRIATSFEESAELFRRIGTECAESIERVAALIAEAVLGGHCLFLCGNGGSAADSQHIAAEMVGRFEREREGLSAIALTTDTSVLTAIANDYGYESVFERQVLALARVGDVVLGISTSGRSPSVVRALQAARIRGAIPLAFTGEEPHACGEAADWVVSIPSPVTARIQEGHLAVGHRICEWVDSEWGRLRAGEIDAS